MNIKEIVGGGTIAKFSHYVAGNLYYKVEAASGIYQFPISTVDGGCKCEPVVCNDDCINSEEFCACNKICSCTQLKLSSDLGTTAFDAEIKAITLMRWIRKAIDNEECYKIG